MITISQSAEVFRANARDIMKTCRTTPRGFRVLAEVDGDGQYRGAGRVTSGTGSLLAHEGRGYAMYLEANPFTSRVQVDDAIDEWETEQADIESAREEASDV